MPAMPDETIIAAARERLSVAMQRLAEAESSLAVAQAAREAASAAAHRDPAETNEMLLEGAERALRVRAKVRDAAQAERDAAHADIHPAAGRAFQPVYVEAVKQRIAAAQKADRARALLGEAERDFAAAREQMSEGVARGLDVTFDNWNNRPLGTEADEIRLWTPANGWWTGLQTMIKEHAE